MESKEDLVIHLENIRAGGGVRADLGGFVLSGGPSDANACANVAWVWWAATRTESHGVVTPLAE